MARSSDAHQHFGLMYIFGQEAGVTSTASKPKKQKTEKPMKQQPISKEAANSQRWNATNRTRQQRSE